MSEDDQKILEAVRRMHSTLSHRAVLLAHLVSDVDLFAEGLRDLGNDLADVGEQCLTRVAELDREPVAANKRQSPHTVALADMLNELAGVSW